MTHLSPVEKGLFKEWTPRQYPAWTSICNRRFQTFFCSRVSLMAGPIAQAEEDGLPQLAPIIALFGERPAVIRKKVGKAVWRQFHGATTFVNVRRAVIHLAEPFVPWDQIVQIKSGHIHSVVKRLVRFKDWDICFFAGTKAVFKDGPDFDHVHMLYTDTKRMGIEVNPEWSVKRLQKEHDAEAKRRAMAQYSSAEWAKPEQHEIDGFTFTRLVSDAEIALEGMEMRHCIAHHIAKARRGAVLVYKITGRERASLAFDTNQKKISSLGGAYFEIKGPCNKRVSLDCLVAAKKLASERGGLRP